MTARRRVEAVVASKIAAGASVFYGSIGSEVYQARGWWIRYATGRIDWLGDSAWAIEERARLNRSLDEVTS